MKLSPLSVSLCAFATTVIVVACSADRAGFEGGPSLLPEDASVPPPPDACGARCSRDLHTVVDGCTAAVLETCDPASGCAAGRCVPACESAARAEGSIGCSFFTTPPDVITQSESSCFAAFVTNTWSAPATLKASLGRDALDISNAVYKAVPTDKGITYEKITGAIAPGEVGIVFLSEGRVGPSSAGNDIRCPPDVEVAWHGIAVEGHATSIYKAFHLETDVPVSAYSIFPYGGADSYLPAATLLLPNASWSNTYLLIDGYGANVDSPFVQIVAQDDDTEVRIRPRVAIEDGTDVPGAPRGSVGKWKLDRGDVLEIIQPASLAGSPLEATKPVGLFGGTRCSYVPAQNAACDALHQQIPPVSQWSTRSTGVPHPTRARALDGTPLPEPVPWRIIGARDGTQLTYSPAKPGGAPHTLGEGEVVEFTTSQVFGVASQDADHPFYLATYMTGGSAFGSLGDPDFVNVIPDDQFLDRYVFFVDYTYRNSALTAVRRKDARGFHDVALDCVGTVTGWQTLDDSTEYTFLQMTEARQDVGNCSYGRHTATSDGPFMLYVWGVDDFASYGYPAGAGSRPVSPIKVEVR